MGLSIRKIEDSGKLIILDDSSKWEVSFIDTIDTRIWMMFDKISMKGDKMTNHSRRDKTITVKTAR